MKAYIVVPLPHFPYYVLYGATDNGRNRYIVTEGYLEFDYNKILCRLTEEQFNSMVEKTRQLVKEKRESEELFKTKAKDLLEEFKS